MSFDNFSPKNCTTHNSVTVKDIFLKLYRNVLIGFSLTVKAATLIFISGRGSAISSAKEGNQVSFIIW